MASFDDLGRALRDDAAANAPRASAIDVDAVTRAARARRRPRQWAVGTLSLVAVLGLGGLAVAAATPPVLIAASESAGDSESTGADQVLAEPGAAEGSPARIDGLLGCGVVPPAPAQGPIGLSLEVLLPTSATAGDELAGVVRLVNLGAEPRTVITPTEAEAVIVHGGVVVGAATVVDALAITTIIDAGVSLELPVRVSTRSCLDGTALPAGDYAVLALVGTRGSPDEPSTIAIGPEGQVRLD